MNQARKELMATMWAGIPPAPKPLVQAKAAMPDRNSSAAFNAPMLEDRQDQLERLAASFSTEAHREEFRYLFSTLKPKECGAILRLHSTCADPKARIRADRQRLDELVQERIDDHSLEAMGIRWEAIDLLKSIRTHSKFADADSILVYCLARAVGYTDVRVSDIEPEETVSHTLHITEARISEIAGEFKSASNPASASEKLLSELSEQFKHRGIGKKVRAKLEASEEAA